MDILIIVPILISILPGLVVLTIVSKSNKNYWLMALIGGAGWLVALIAREPILIFIGSLGLYLRVCIASFLAGLFEEVTRYLILKYFISKNIDPYPSLSIGLGWGLTEALLLYAIQVPLAASIYGYQWTDFLPGAIERNTAILFHLGMAMLITLGVIGLINAKIALSLAICLHTVLNIIAGIAAIKIENVWVIEGIIALIALAVVLPIIYYFLKNVLKRK